jgi:hypothetical protein
MRRESHVRFWEGGGVRLPSATRRASRMVSFRLDRAVAREAEESTRSDSCLLCRSKQIAARRSLTHTLPTPPRSVRDDSQKAELADKE